jgi:AcrR family transcriptional regulator
MPRSRSVSAHEKVLAAAIELIAEQGIDATSMDAIAGRSGVSKATIYKHWADKDALVLEVMAKVNCLDVRPTFDSGNTRSDLIAVLAYRPDKHENERQKILPHFMAYAAHHEELGRAWRNMVMDPPRCEIRHLLELGMAKRELTRKLDLDICIAMLLGPMLYWFLFLRCHEGDPKRLAEKVVDAFWKAFRTPEHTERSAAVPSRLPSRTRPSLSGSTPLS